MEMFDVRKYLVQAGVRPSLVGLDYLTDEVLSAAKTKMGHFDAFTRMLPKSTILLRALWNVEFVTRFVLLWIITRTSLRTLASVIVTGTESTHFQIAYMPWFTCFRKQKLTT